MRTLCVSMAILTLTGALGCGRTCGPCKDKLDACVASCDADFTGCTNDCQTTTNVGGCEDSCDAELEACDADCVVDTTECEEKEC